MSLPNQSPGWVVRQSADGNYVEICCVVDDVELPVSAVKYGVYSEGIARLAEQQGGSQPQTTTPQPDTSQQPGVQAQPEPQPGETMAPPQPQQPQ